MVNDMLAHDHSQVYTSEGLTPKPTCVCVCVCVCMCVSESKAHVYVIASLCERGSKKKRDMER